MAVLKNPEADMNYLGLTAAIGVRTLKTVRAFLPRNSESWYIRLVFSSTGMSILESQIRWRIGVV